MIYRSPHVPGPRRNSSMKRNHWIAAAVVVVLAAVTVFAVLSNKVSNDSTTQATYSPTDLSTQTLRDLADRHGLRVGTAINYEAWLEDPKYDDIAASQFSTITAENVMKWESLEPTRGTYNWGPADELVAFAQEHGQL